jgi:hypothetical protein
MLEASLFFAAPVDLLTSETVSVVGPVGTVIGVILGLYWALQREGLVTGKAHRREVEKLSTDLTRERLEHDDTIKAMREDYHGRIKDIRDDWERQASRREAENQGTIAGLRADVARLYGAWQITESSAERLVRSRIRADDETILTLMEAIRRSQNGERLELPTTTIGSSSGPDDDGRPDTGPGHERDS